MENKSKKKRLIQQFLKIYDQLPAEDQQKLDAKIGRRLSRKQSSNINGAHTIQH